MKNDKMRPVQGFAFGGIANPTQRVTLRSSDRAYLEARQREAEAYERQRLAYNKALEDYQSKEQTEEFRMARPVVPFDEAQVAARQQQAAQRARRDAGNRAVAIDVVSDPDRFGFGSLSIADRFMAEGGEVRGYAEGGEADEDEDEEGVGEVGSAKALLAQLEGQGPRSKKKAAPALKRMAMSGGAAMPKPMDMSPESLASTRELVAMAQDKGTAKEQMQELARLYQLRAATFSQPTLAGETFNKNTLATKRFKEGGEAKKDLPTVMEVRDYATEASERLFPDQGGQDDQRDAARHMLAAAVVAKKYGSNAAKLLGLAHEYSSNPQTFFSGLGIGQPRDDFEYDEHNNRVGMGLASRATSREALEALVREMAAKSSTEKREGLPYIMSQEKMDARAAKAAKGPAPRPQGYQKGGEAISDPEEALFEGRGDVPAPAGRDKVLDQILGAGETALTLGTGAASSLVGMPYGLYKGLTSGKYLEGKAADIAGKEAAAFMERNTYQPRTESAQENLAALARIADKMKLTPAPGGAAIASIPRTAALAQGERLGMAAEKALEGPVTRTMERGGKAADLLSSFGTQPSRVVPSTPAPTTPPKGSVKTPAPASELGFYSAAEQAALNLPRKEGTGAAFLNDLMKAPDVKKEELSAMGLDEFLKSKPKATRQEVQDFIANNRFDVKEVQLGGKMDFANLSDDQLQKEYVRVRGYKPEDGFGDLMSREEIIDELSGVPAADLTKFNQYQLPGGDNYREILLTIPFKEPAMPKGYDVTSMQYDDGTVRYFANTPTTRSSAYKTEADAMAELQRMTSSLKDFRKKAESYKSPHFDEPNILAHLRVNDRVDADGKKMLLIEELQSDWHQAGRDKGYATADINSRLKESEKELEQIGLQIRGLSNRMTSLSDAEIDEFNKLADERQKLFDRQGFLMDEGNALIDKRNAGVPDAPFKDTWHQLALKRALKYAADNGYDRVGLTTGKQQAQRYNLSKQVDNISYEPTEKGFYINVISKEGQNVLNGDYSAKELEGIVGKEITQKMLGKQGANEFDPKVEPDLANVKTLTGVDLQVGGEGMKKYYDEIYPGFLAKQAKKYGSQVGETSIKTQTSAPAYVDYFVGPGRFNATAVLGVRADGTTEIINQTPNSLRAAQQLANRYKEKHLGGGKEAVRYIDITPEMKGAVPYAKGGPVDKNTAFIKAHS